MPIDFHAEAQRRFTEDTRPISVRSKQTMINKMNLVLKGIDISLLAIDGVQTHDFLRKGTCHEVDPIAKPFVHYTPFAVAASAGLAWSLVRIAPNRLANTLLGVFAVGEGLNVLRNHAIGCE